MEPMGRPSKHAPEVRERAVGLVFDHAPEHPSQWAAIRSVGEKLGIRTESLRRWVRQAERDPEDALWVFRCLADQIGRTESGVLKRYDRKPKRPASKKIYRSTCFRDCQASVQRWRIACCFTL